MKKQFRTEKLRKLVWTTYLWPKRLAKDLMDQLLKQHYCWHKSMLNWRRFQWRGQIKRKSAMIGTSGWS